MLMEEARSEGVEGETDSGSRIWDRARPSITTFLLSRTQPRDGL